MKIKKTFLFEVKKKGNVIICKDIPTLCMVCGSRAVSGNYHMYGITKKGNDFHVDFEKLKKRYEMLVRRKEELEDTLSIMKQVVKGKGKK